MAFRRLKKHKEYKLNSVTNTYAILSLVFGILFFIPFSPILAIIFGFLALGQIKHTEEPGRGLAIAGIVLGFFWIVLFLALFVLIILGLASTTASLMPLLLQQ